MTSVRAELNADEWHRDLNEFLSEFEEMNGTSLILDEANSFKDVLSFDIANFFGDISSEFTIQLCRRYGNIVAVSFEPDPSFSRKKMVTLTVRLPASNSLQALHRIYGMQSALMENYAWPLWAAILLVVISLLILGHAAFSLHEYTTARDDPFSVLGHFFLHHLARLWLFAELK